jgi:molybdate transport system substrate-binding protein
MPGDVWYVEELDKKEGIIESQTSVASFVPVIITTKGNPLRISGLKDLLRKEVKVAVGNSKSCQIGRVTMKILKKNKLDTKDLGLKVALTVNELGVWVKMKDVDTAIVWDAIAANILKDIEVITIPKEKNIISKVVIGVLKGSKNKNLAYKFINFIVSENGKEILKNKGYRISDE